MHYKFKAALLKGVTKDTVIKTQDNFFLCVLWLHRRFSEPFFPVLSHGAFSPYDIHRPAVSNHGFFY